MTEDEEQFDKRDGAARIARAACGEFKVFEQSVAWFTMIRAIKMAQEEKDATITGLLARCDQLADHRNSLQVTLAAKDAEIAELEEENALLRSRG